MQDRYVGDIGDYVKLAILRALSPGQKLGVAWWRYPDEDHNTDGRHINYLDQPWDWRHLDPDLFDALKTVVAGGARAIAALENRQFLPGATFASELIPTTGSTAQRRVARLIWFRRAQAMLASCDLIFADPDNGLETKNFDPGAAKAGKSVGLNELLELRVPGRTLVVYHHQTRMAGGHAAEIAYWGARLKQVGFSNIDALRAPKYSPRVFFLIDANQNIRERAHVLAETWGDKLSWYPSLEE